MQRLAGLVAALVLAAVPALAQAPIPYMKGPLDPSQQLATFNTLIQEIDGFLAPVFPQVANQANYVSLIGGTTGIGATIAAAGADSNVALKVSPKGNGNIVLFSSADNINSTGVIKVGNLASWLPVRGMALCPAVVPGQAQLGMADHITGYLIVKDWLDRPHGMPGC